MSKEVLSAQLGRVFEVLFNCGYLRVLKTGVNDERLLFYDEYLSALTKKLIDKQVSEIFIDRETKKLSSRWLDYFFEQGYLCGISFASRLLENVKSRGRCKLKYFQSIFASENGFTGINETSEEFLKKLTSCFNLQDVGNRYGKGQFLHADNLLWLETQSRLTKEKENFIIVVDLSASTWESAYLNTDITNPRNVYKILRRDYKRQRRKSIFNELSIDSSEDAIVNFSDKISRYFTAFSSNDKETVKTIQAASYAWDFLKYLTDAELIDSKSGIQLSAFGYTNRGINGITLYKESYESDPKQYFTPFKKCYDIYSKKTDKEASEARREVFNLLRYADNIISDDARQELMEFKLNSTKKIKFFNSYEEGKDFFGTRSSIPAEIAQKYDIPLNTPLIAAHAFLVKRTLADKNAPRILFLTGNPGIGKTTAISDFVKSLRDSGFWLFYASPRTTVNRDVQDKFCDIDGVMYLTVNSNIVAKDKVVVGCHYSGWDKGEKKTIGGIEFDNDIINRINSGKYVIKHTSSEELKINDGYSFGVLKSLSEAVSACFKEPELPKNIVTAVALQSLRQTEKGTTFSAIRDIFQNLCINSKTNEIVPKKVESYCHKIKNIVFMIDEVTGSSEGVKFVEEIQKLVADYKLDSYFNIWIIVADASLNTQEVVADYFKDSDPELEKIYVRRSVDDRACLYQSDFTFKNKPARIINANSYPASKFNVNYNLFVKSQKWEEYDLKNSSELDEFAQMCVAEMKTKIKGILNQEDSQILVFIQDRKVLQKLKREFIKEGILQDSEIAEFNSERSEIEREKDYEKIKEGSNVRLVLMTSSAARGLSFPEAKHIMVEIPSFMVEKNLMEICQVIYRGRGGRFDQSEKNIHFYISHRAFYDESLIDINDSNRHYSIQESLIEVISIVALVKSSIFTRIQGAFLMEKTYYSVVPVGEKGLFDGNQTFLEYIIEFLTRFHNEINGLCGEQKRKLQKIYDVLLPLFSRQELKIFLKREQRIHLQDVEDRFLFQGSLKELIDADAPQALYIRGNLCIQPLTDFQLQEMNTFYLEKVKNVSDKILDDIEALAKFRHVNEDGTESKIYLAQEIRSCLKMIGSLIRQYLKDSDMTKRSVQSFGIGKNHRYLAYPLNAFLPGNKFAEFFESPDAANYNFRESLTLLVKDIANVRTVIPSNGNYSRFPWVIFSSPIFEYTQSKIFSRTQLLQSKEMSLFNLLLLGSSSGLYHSK